MPGTACLSQAANSVASLATTCVGLEPVRHSSVNLRVHVSTEEGGGNVSLHDVPVVVRSDGQHQANGAQARDGGEGVVEVEPSRHVEAFNDAAGLLHASALLLGDAVERDRAAA